MNSYGCSDLPLARKRQETRNTDPLNFISIYISNAHCTRFILFSQFLQLVNILTIRESALTMPTVKYNLIETQ